MKILEITLLFLGSVIGAGFATGAEIITFFSQFQLPIWLIAIIVGITMLSVITLEISLNYRISPQMQHRQPNIHLNHATDIALLIIYFILFTAMTAGIAQITNRLICILSLVISTCFVLFGFKQLTHLNFYLVLVIIVLIITTAIPHLQATYITKSQWEDIPKNVLWAFLYAGLNCFMFPELIKASSSNYSRRDITIAGIITSILVTILVDLILATILNTNTKDTSIPLLAAAPNAITMLVILLAILTSQYTTLFAIQQRYKKITTKNRSIKTITGICILAFLFSFCGFNNLINFTYPIIGAITCAYLLFSCLHFWWFSLRSSHQH